MSPDADDYSMEKVLPLADCLQNLDIFSMITRKDVDAGDIFVIITRKDVDTGDIFFDAVLNK